MLTVTVDTSAWKRYASNSKTSSKSCGFKNTSCIAHANADSSLSELIF